MQPLTYGLKTWDTKAHQYMTPFQFTAITDSNTFNAKQDKKLNTVHAKAMAEISFTSVVTSMRRIFMFFSHLL